MVDKYGREEIKMFKKIKDLFMCEAQLLGETNEIGFNI